MRDYAQITTLLEKLLKKDIPFCLDGGVLKRIWWAKGEIGKCANLSFSRLDEKYSMCMLMPYPLCWEQC